MPNEAFNEFLRLLITALAHGDGLGSGVAPLVSVKKQGWFAI